MNQGIGRHRYLKHWMIAMGLLLLTAILCAWIQNRYLLDLIGILFFTAVCVVGLLFSTPFAWLQYKTRNSYLSTGLFVSFLSLYLLLYAHLQHSVNWRSVTAGYIQLSLYQETIKSGITFGIAFTFPFLFSILYFSVRSKRAKTKKSS